MRTHRIRVFDPLWRLGVKTSRYGRHVLHPLTLRVGQTVATALPTRPSQPLDNNRSDKQTHAMVRDANVSSSIPLTWALYARPKQKVQITLSHTTNCYPARRPRPET